MKVKVRKVGNSLVLTVPAGVAEEAGLCAGQELEVSGSRGSIEYAYRPKGGKIDWSKYELCGEELREGMDSLKYIDSLRDEVR